MSNETQTEGVAAFQANAIYSRAALASMLGGIVEADRFRDRLKIPRRFKNAVLGADILAAMQNPPEGADLSPDVARGGSFDVDAILYPDGKPKGRRPGRKPSNGLRKLSLSDTTPRPAGR